MADEDPWKSPSEKEEADDLFIEEGDDDKAKDKKKKGQDEVRNKGMLLVSGSEWKGKLKETLIGACKDEEKKKALASNGTITAVIENIEKVSEATCLVLRRTNGKGRLEYFKQIGDDERLEKAKKGKGGCGTGFLMFPKSPVGWLVITNNHVIMDQEEAESAEVIFNHLDDDSKANTKPFNVQRLVSKDVRTKNAEDEMSLDFSLLLLKSDGTGEKYLQDRALEFEESARVNNCANQSMLKTCGLHFTPIIAFSHPHGLGKRFSIGKFPDKCEEYPTAHIKHDLPTARGSSGANLIVAPPEKDLFIHWGAAFVHYRHGHAVAWQAIAPVVRSNFSSLKVRIDFSPLK